MLANFPDFQVQTRMKKFVSDEVPKGITYTCNEAVSIQYNGTKEVFQLFKRDKHWELKNMHPKNLQVDRDLSSLNFTSKPGFNVLLGNGATVTIFIDQRGFLDVTIGTLSKYMNSVSGICGPYDGVQNFSKNQTFTKTTCSNLKEDSKLCGYYIPDVPKRPKCTPIPPPSTPTTTSGKDSKTPEATKTLTGQTRVTTTPVNDLATSTSTFLPSTTSLPPPSSPPPPPPPPDPYNPNCKLTYKEALDKCSSALKDLSVAIESGRLDFHIHTCAYDEVVTCDLETNLKCNQDSLSLTLHLEFNKMCQSSDTATQQRGRQLLKQYNYERIVLPVDPHDETPRNDKHEAIPQNDYEKPKTDQKEDCPTKKVQQEQQVQELQQQQSYGTGAAGSADSAENGDKNGGEGDQTENGNNDDSFQATSGIETLVSFGFCSALTAILAVA